MQALTIKQAGVEGVYRAIADGMKAAAYARELDAMTAERDALRAECEALTAENNAQKKEIMKLRALCKRYRRERQADREAGAQARLSGNDGRRERRMWIAVIAMIGAILAFAVDTGIVTLMLR